MALSLNKAMCAAVSLVAAMTTHAAVITKTSSLQAVVDSASAARTVDILAADLGGALDQITKVTISIDFMKCADPLATPLPSKAAGCSDPGSAFAREIIFLLTGPSTTQVHLVDADTYFGASTFDPTPGARITVVFDDAAAEFVGTGGFIDGTFRPVSPLDDFAGQGAVGTWELHIEDDAADAPLGFASFTLDITVADATAVPEPATTLLFGLGFAGISLLRRRRR